jgi:hypothetical protein
MIEQKSLTELINREDGAGTGLSRRGIVRPDTPRPTGAQDTSRVLTAGDKLGEYEDMHRHYYIVIDPRNLREIAGVFSRCLVDYGRDPIDEHDLGEHRPLRIHVRGFPAKDMHGIAKFDSSLLRKQSFVIYVGDSTYIRTSLWGRCALNMTLYELSTLPSREQMIPVLDNWINNNLSTLPVRAEWFETEEGTVKHFVFNTTDKVVNSCASGPIGWIAVFCSSLASCLVIKSHVERRNVTFRR